MSVDWARLDQPTFDRIVEALMRHRFGDKVRAVNGRGGDGGIDIEITLGNGRLWILELKFYPDGFSSVHAKRHQEIKKSFEKARQTRALDTGGSIGLHQHRAQVRHEPQGRRTVTKDYRDRPRRP
jgi:Restriction endonuclease